ncbi:MAG: putative ATP-dependent RNA helicase [Methanocella sp. PtaU1.Bin125]|nr:MAG: putative ATP-dependent RNA helicase [Methanocella sp. PtaU1.Bin125]
MIDRKLLYDTLEQHFGYRTFRPFQEEIITDIAGGHDVLAIIATGGGKSLCYQLPALLSGGVTIVVSPLISLMKDQVDDLVANGIPAATLNSSMSIHEIRSIERDLLAGVIRVLYISPEKVTQETFLQFLGKLDVRLIAVDEAHCISMWGHQFRPEYRKLSTLKARFPGIPMIALTASAIPEVREDIVNQLKLASPKRYIGSFNRKNLSYRIMDKKGALPQIIGYVCSHRGMSGIIYCLQKRTTEEIADKLQKAGIRALPYHADLSDPVRSSTQEKFVKDNVDVICATVAFGMGIDKPDVRYVIHYDMPKNLESYYQETGRAGRDGEPSDCILFYSAADAMKLKSLIEHEYDDERLNSVAVKKWRAMMDYCETRLCRRSFLLRYFGEAYDEAVARSNGCGGCDNCLNPRDTIDGSEIAKKIVTCVSSLQGRFGVSHIADVICGSASRKILEHHHDRNPAYNTGKPYSKTQWITFIKELVRLGYLSIAGDKYPVVVLNEKCMEIVDNTAQVLLTKPAEEQVTVTVKADGKYDTRLFQILRDARKRIADANGWPPYVVFHDTALKEMARTYPCSDEDFAKVPGVGRTKLERFGGEFIAAIRQYVDAEGIKKADRPASQASPALQASHTAQATQASLDAVMAGNGREERAFRTFETAVRQATAKPEANKANDGLFEEAVELQKRVDHLSRELESAKRSLDEVMKKLNAAGPADADQ